MKSLFKVTDNGVIILSLNKQEEGEVLCTFVHFLPRVILTNAQENNISLTHMERLCAVGCRFKSKLVRLLSLGSSCHFDPRSNMKVYCKMMTCIVRRVAAGLAAAVRDKTAKEAERLCVSGQCAAAVVPLQCAIYLGDLPSRALMAHLMLDGREGIALDRDKAFELVEEGARLGCYDCKGVIAEYYWYDNGSDELSLELARESSGSGFGSRYGQFALGNLKMYNFIYFYIKLYYI
jgi:hypothetical protein